jgi:hypothetical protein
MEVGINTQEIVSWIREILGGDVSETADSYRFYAPEKLDAKALTATKTQLDAVLTSLQEKNVDGDMTLFSEQQYEVIVRQESTLFFPRVRFGNAVEPLEDTANGITYELSPLSHELVVFLLWKTAELDPQNRLHRGIHVRRLWRVRPQFRPEIDEPNELGVLEFLATSAFRSLSLKVSSQITTPVSRFKQLADAYMFQLGYNTDIALVPLSNMEELLRGARMSRMRRAKVDEIDPPRKLYEKELVHHYLLGISSESPFMEYLSYYHIAEHFFESVFKDNLIEQIREQLTLPDFSYHRKKDISKLIKLVTRSIQIRDQETTFNEEEALRLTLAKHVTIEDLVKKLNQYDDSLVDYYGANPVPFSEGKVVNLIDGNQERVTRDLAGRIYKTRNALVHSKEGDRAKFTPFQDDRDLAREIPLARFVAESIVLSTSSPIS